MRVIGLTGNIASGKTAVAQRLAQRGASIIDADELARDVVVKGSPALESILKRWGPGVLDADGSLDRAALRHIVFENQADLDELNDIIHPEIRKLRTKLIEEARKRGDKVVVCVVPLLFERHLAGEFDTIILVDAPRSLRLERIVRDRGIDEAEAMKMIASQMPADLKLAGSDYFIDNSGSLQELEAEVDRLWDDISAGNDSRASALSTAD